MNTEKNIIDKLFEKKNILHNYLVKRSNIQITDNLDDIKIVKTITIEGGNNKLLSGGNNMNFRTAMESSFKRMYSRLNK